ncbi:hypothetical protein RDI58_007932 [Solanum bulbocastanum]|uniref:Major facilitator superfamily (MFS) profile domain-containing protein n=1 Tax=Solanum bulbocastanum TaxID=147425 RepID=A0AAN8TXA2_SOLBU
MMAAMGGVIFGYDIGISVTRAYGRKASILLGGANFLAGGAASNIYMLIIGRVLLGVGVGFANQRPRICLLRKWTGCGENTGFGREL